jgi:hypothetical protein
MTTLKRATIKNYTAGTHRASVQIAGSLSVWLADVPVATDIPAADVVADRECAVLFFTDDNPDDAVIIAVYGAAPAAPPATGIAIEEDNATVHSAATTLDFTEPDSTITSVSGAEVDVNMGLYTLLAGRATPQTIHGGLAANNVLTLKGTSHGTTASARVDIVSSDLRIATNGKRIEASDGAERIRLQTANPHVVLTGATHMATGSTLTTGGVGVNLSPVTHAYANVGNTSTGVDSKIGMLVDMGSATGGPSASVIGVAGRALIRDAATSDSFGLDYIAGASGRSGTAVGARTAAFLSGSGQTLSYEGFHARGGTVILGTITLWKGFAVRDIPSSGITDVQPFYEDVARTGDSQGNRFRSNSQFGSTTGSFGGGDGVIGIRNAATNPGSNPSNGGVLYAESGALKWRGSGGTVTTIAAA